MLAVCFVRLKIAIYLLSVTEFITLEMHHQKSFNLDWPKPVSASKQNVTNIKWLSVEKALDPLSRTHVMAMETMMKMTLF